MTAAPDSGETGTYWSGFDDGVHGGWPAGFRRGPAGGDGAARVQSIASGLIPRAGRRAGRAVRQGPGLHVGNGTRYEIRATRLVEFVAGLDDRQPVDATPAWNVHDLIAHVTGVAVDVASHNVDAYAQPSWTALQVTSRAHRSRESLITEWRDAWPALSAILDDPRSRGFDAAFAVMPLVDLLAHEHDLRESVGLSEFADPDVWLAVEQRRRDVLTVQCNTAACSLVIDTPQGDHWELGSHPRHLHVTADRYELWRSLEGRRTRVVVRGFDWDQDPQPFLDAWVGSVFHWPEDHLD